MREGHPNELGKFLEYCKDFAVEPGLLEFPSTAVFAPREAHFSASGRAALLGLAPPFLRRTA
ncbi:MAG: hypothetical protein DMG88_10365 [Acidobacteria bacterium]|nr:MAG: hypothetical protein DMG88_10365 [Acidobacteriota bacterium]